MLLSTEDLLNVNPETTAIITALETGFGQIAGELVRLRVEIKDQFRQHDTDLRTVIESVDGRVAQFSSLVKSLINRFTGDEDVTEAESGSVQERAETAAAGTNAKQPTQRAADEWQHFHAELKRAEHERAEADRVIPGSSFFHRP